MIPVYPEAVSLQRMKYGKALALGVLGFFFGDGVEPPDEVSGLPAVAPAAPPPAPFPEFFLRFRLPGLITYSAQDTL
jgi:hypothetical protein